MGKVLRLKAPAAAVADVGQDLTLTPIKGAPSAELNAVKALARAKGAKRLALVNRYLDELWRLCTDKKVGYDSAALAAQSAHETAWWTSDAWDQKLSAVGIGADDDRPFAVWPAWKTPEQSARAHVVHLSAYLGGYVAALRPHIALDPKWQAVFEQGYIFRVSTLRDLTGKWASDAYYAEKIADKLRAIRAQIPTPEPEDAPLPEGIIWLGTGNWHERYPGASPRQIVYHITDDLVLQRTIDWFQNPESEASSHVVIDRDGKIYQFVRSTKAAWTNGDVRNPRTDIRLLGDLLDVAADWPRPHTVNDFSLTIEHVGTPNDPPTEAQYRSSIAISAYWRDLYEIPISRATCLRHGDINSVDRSYCPGPRFDLARVITELGGDPEDLAA